MSTETAYREKLDELESSLLKQTARLRDLTVMGTIITSIHEIDTVLSVVMDMSLRLVNGEVGLIMLEENGELKVKISWGVGEDFVKTLMYQDNLDIASYCFKTREAVILSDLDIVSDEGISLNSVIAVPIKKSDKCFGLVVIINNVDGTGFDDDDRGNLEVLLNYVAVAVDNSLLLKDRLRQQKIKQEMDIARQIQKTILPEHLDTIPGVEIGAVYFPARDVGGDFYDAVPLPDNKILVILGDVSNKGVPAALVMSALSGIMKSTVRTNPEISVSELANQLNQVLALEIIKDREMFVTLFIAKYDLENGLLTSCNAGHPSSLFWEEETKKVHLLSQGGPILGQFPEIDYQQEERQVRSGDRLFLFTDGLTEAMDSDYNIFGTERVEQVFTAESGLPPTEFCHKVKEWVDSFAVGASEETYDDFTLMLIKVD